MKHSKIAVIGAGRVGTTTAYALMLKDLAAEILLVDIDPQHCRGEILDLSDVLSFSATSIIREANYKDAGQADIIIITAGIAQKPGQPRTELMATNGNIIRSIMEKIQPINPETIVLMVTNPVDVMAYQAFNYAKLPANQVFGSGTLLDSKRLEGFVAQKLGVAEESVEIAILGEHGDTQFPVWSSAHVSGTPLLQWPDVTQKLLDSLAQKSREKVYEIIACKGSTFFGIASCTASICQSILFDQKRVLTVSVYDKAKDLYYSMPAVVGQNGIEKVIELHLSDQEKQLLEKSRTELTKIRTELP